MLDPHVKRLDPGLLLLQGVSTNSGEIQLSPQCPGFWCGAVLVQGPDDDAAEAEQIGQRLNRTLGSQIRKDGAAIDGPCLRVRSQQQQPRLRIDQLALGDLLEEIARRCAHHHRLCQPP